MGKNDSHSTWEVRVNSASVQSKSLQIELSVSQMQSEEEL